jgi:uncharacterized protein (TIGR02996 family)
VTVPTDLELAGQSLVAACRAAPDDVDARAVLADWLDEHAERLPAFAANQASRHALRRLRASDGTFLPARLLRRAGDPDTTGRELHDLQEKIARALRPLGAVELEWFRGLPYLRVPSDRSPRVGLCRLLRCGYATAAAADWLPCHNPRVRAWLATVGWGRIEARQAGDADLLALSELPPLESVQLEDTNVTDAGLAEFARSPAAAGLRRLRLARCETLTDDAVPAAPALPAVRSLHLQCCHRLGDLAIERLLGRTELEALNLAHTRITDAAVARLPALARLTYVDLSMCQGLTPAVLDSLTELPALETLGLQVCNWLTDDSLTRLAELPGLGELYLTGCTTLTPAATGRLAALGNLRTLILARSGWLTDEALAPLAALRRLRFLSLEGCGSLTEAGIAALEQALPGCVIAR